MAVRILIADDHALFRAGLRSLLEVEADFKVVGEAADGEEALRLARKLKPDILLLDLAMPRMPGLEVLRELSKHSYAMRTILLTAMIEKKQILEAIQLGAKGVVLKESALELLRKSILAVMAGQFWIGRDSVGDVVSTLRELSSASREEDRRKNFGLTSRELEIVAAVVAGNSNKDIAQKFFLSEDTVKHHMTSIFNKMGVSTRLELAVSAIHHKLVKEV